MSLFSSEHSFLFGSKILASKAKRMFTRLNPPIQVFSNKMTCSELVGRAIKHLVLSRCTQSLNELAELHFLGLNLDFSLRKLALNLHLENYKEYLDLEGFSFSSTYKISLQKHSLLQILQNFLGNYENLLPSSSAAGEKIVVSGWRNI